MNTFIIILFVILAVAGVVVYLIYKAGKTVSEWETEEMMREHEETTGEGKEVETNQRKQSAGNWGSQVPVVGELRAPIGSAEKLIIPSGNRLKDNSNYHTGRPGSYDLDQRDEWHRLALDSMSGVLGDANRMIVPSSMLAEARIGTPISYLNTLGTVTTHPYGVDGTKRNSYYIIADEKPQVDYLIRYRLDVNRPVFRGLHVRLVWTNFVVYIIDIQVTNAMLNHSSMTEYELRSGSSVTKGYLPSYSNIIHNIYNCKTKAEINAAFMEAIKGDLKQYKRAKPCENEAPVDLINTVIPMKYVKGKWYADVNINIKANHIEGTGKSCVIQYEGTTISMVPTKTPVSVGEIPENKITEKV